MDMPISNPGDPLTPGVGRHEGREASRPQGRDEPHPDPGAADLLRRRAAAPRRPRGSGRARGMARSAAASPTTSARAREGAPQGRSSTGTMKPVYDVIAPHSRGRAARRVGRARQPPRRLGERRRRPDLRAGRPAGRSARPRRAAEAGMEAEAHDRLLRVWDGEEPVLLGSTEWAERTPRSCGSTPSPTSTPTGTVAGYLSMSRAPTPSSTSSTTWRATSQDPEKRRSRCGSARRRKPLADAPTSAEERKAIRARADLRIDALGSGSRLHRLPRPPGRRLPQPRLRRRGRRRHLSLDLRRLLLVHALRDTDFAYGKALAQTAGSAVMRLADADLLPFDFTGLADTVQEYLDELEEAPEAQAGGDRGAQQRARRRRLQRDRRSRGILRRSRPAESPAAPQLRASRERRRSVTFAARALRESRRGPGQGRACPPRARSHVNALLIQSERKLTRVRRGLPRRPWYKHLIYAPGGTTRATAPRPSRVFARRSSRRGGRRPTTRS